MNELDSYLRREYRDAEYRHYQIHTATPWGAWRTWWARWTAPRRVEPLPTGEVSLAAARVVVWKVPAHAHVFCREGSLWLTKSGDSRDWTLVAGQGRTLEHGEWVVQALATAQVRVSVRREEEVPHGQTSLLPAF